MLYDMPLYRPPSEGQNLIIQVTYGCSFNQCSFCSMYKSKSYLPRPMADIFDDIEDAAADWPQAHRVFLADGDAMGLDFEDLQQILGKLAEALPNLTRVSAYATPVNLLRKTPQQLEALRALRLSLVYVGIESGSADILKRITKGARPGSIEKALGKAQAAGIKVSATVILGLGGKGLWRQHIAGTVELINKTAPTYLSTLLLGLEKAQEPRFMRRFERLGGRFAWQDEAATLEELKQLVGGLDPVRPIIFRSNHASNALALAGNLPKDKSRLLVEIATAQTDQSVLRPRFMRGF